MKNISVLIIWQRREWVQETVRVLCQFG